MEQPLLYHLTTRLPDSVTAAVVCTYEDKSEIIIVAKGQYLEALDIVDDDFNTKCRINLFSTIRSISTSGGSTFFLANGNAEVLEYSFSIQTSTFEIVSRTALIPSDISSDGLQAGGSNTSSELPILHANSLRRTIPGEYLAADSRNRVIFTCAIEKARTVLTKNDGVINAFSANQTMTVCYDMLSFTPKNVDSNNSSFVCLEKIRYGSMELCLYQFNLGLNLMLKSWSCSVPQDSNFAVTLNSFIVVFTDSEMLLINSTGKIIDKLEGQVVCATAVKVGFIIAQLISTEWVSIKIILSESGASLEKSQVRGLITSLARSCVILDKGYVVVFPQQGGDDVIAEIVNSKPLEVNVVCSNSSLSPLLAATLRKRQIVACSGANSTSKIKSLEMALPVTEFAQTELPNRALRVFCCKQRKDSVGHDLIVLCFSNSTTTLTVTEEGSVEEVGESVTGLSESIETLGVSFVSSGLCQIHSRGFRFIVNKQVSTWLAPNRALITCFAFSPSQVVIALDSGYIIYFEARETGLVESQQRILLKANAIAFKYQNAHELRSSEIIVSDSSSNCLRVYSTENLRQVKLLSLQWEVISLLSTKDALYAAHTNGRVTIQRDDEQQVVTLGNKAVSLFDYNGSAIAVIPNRNAFLLTDWMVLPISRSLIFDSCHIFLTSEGECNLAAVSKNGLHIFNLAANLGTVTTDDSESQGTIVANLYFSNGVNVILTDKLIKTEASAISINDPVDSQDHQKNPAINFGATIKFDDSEYLAVAAGLSLYIYKLNPYSKLEFVYTTPISSKCNFLCPFNGMLLTALRNEIILFTPGKKQLLRKSYIKLEASNIKSVRCSRDLIYVGDSQASVQVVRFSNHHLQLVAADFVPRGSQSMALLDHSSICIGDRLGNIALLRFVKADDLNDSNKSTRSNTHEILTSVDKLELLNSFCVNDAITSLSKGILSPAGVESIVYTTISGTCGVLTPLVTSDEYKTMKLVERVLQRKVKTHLNFRSGIASPRNIVDGDLCELILQSENSDLCADAAEELDLLPLQLKISVSSSRCRV